MARGARRATVAASSAVPGWVGPLVPLPLRVQVSRCPKDLLCLLPIYAGDVAYTTAAHRTLEAVGSSAGLGAGSDRAPPWRHVSDAFFTALWGLTLLVV